MSFFIRVEGLDPEDLSDNAAHDLTDRLFADICEDYPEHYDDLTGVIPVLNEAEHARLVAASTIERPTEQDAAIGEPEMATDGGATPWDPWCDWCQMAFKDGPDWKVEATNITGWFCTENCADQWRSGDTTPERVGQQDDATPETEEDGEQEVMTDGGREPPKRKSEPYHCGFCDETSPDPATTSLPCGCVRVTCPNCGKTDELHETFCRADEVATDGGTDLATYEFTVENDGSSIVYGPWNDGDEWMLALSTATGERVRLLLGEAAMYELWTETHNTPRPRAAEPRDTLSREIVEKVNGMNADQLREVLDAIEDVGGQR
ncbi:hypothetical protein [Halorussus pelagicus]|uniref:hypothetical protein n=1 Tax=Halorussus pelagicus TaxID=2505977 RepID=UPI000FFB5B86|nr:hypothetical protein [Halorussus pelagicus]